MLTHLQLQTAVETHYAALSLLPRPLLLRPRARFPNFAAVPPVSPDLRNLNHWPILPRRTGWMLIRTSVMTRKLVDAYGLGSLSGKCTPAHLRRPHCHPDETTSSSSLSMIVRSCGAFLRLVPRRHQYEVSHTDGRTPFPPACQLLSD